MKPKDQGIAPVEQAQPTDRELMELAVEEMRLSRPQRGRRDPSPLVGTVALLRDGRILKAHRAHQRDGEHAEESLLERVADRMEDFEEARFFVTLEPCSPGSRGVREIPCAERLAAARVAEVWIGMMDPNATIDGEGGKFLLRRGVSVRRFDPDLRTQIEEENKTWSDWIAGQTRAPAAAATIAAPDAVAPEDVLRQVFPTTTVADLDRRAVDLYRERLKLRVRPNSDQFRQSLFEDGVLDAAGANAHLTGLGIVAMASRPRRFIEQAGLNAMIQAVDAELPPLRMNEPAVLIPDMVETWLRESYPDAYDRDHGSAGQKERLPFKAIREGVINGLVHRRWDLDPKCKLFVDDRRQVVTVKSPGEPRLPVTLGDLERLQAEAWPQNKKLADLFSRLILVEEQGLGMRTFRELRDRGFPRPTYSLSQNVLTLTIFRTKDAFNTQRLEADWVKPPLRQAWAIIGKLETISTAEYQRETKLDRRTAQRHLSAFFDHGWLEQEAGTSGPTTRYRIVAG